MAEDQHPIEHQIHDHGGHTGHHGHGGLVGFPQRAGIGIGDGKGRQTKQHHLQIFQTIEQGKLGIFHSALALQVQPDQGIAAQQENADAAHRNGRTGQQLEAEGVAHTLVILAAEELGGKNTRAGDGTENAQVKYEQQLVYNGHAAHLHGADLAHHDIIQQGNKIGDAVLDDNGQHHRQHPAVKGSVAYKFV